MSNKEKYMAIFSANNKSITTYFEKEEDAESWIEDMQGMFCVSSARIYNPIVSYRVSVNPIYNVRLHEDDLNTLQGICELAKTINYALPEKVQLIEDLQLKLDNEKTQIG